MKYTFTPMQQVKYFDRYDEGHLVTVLNVGRTHAKIHYWSTADINVVKWVRLTSLVPFSQIAG